MNTPELLSPAGTLNNMRYAFAYGADAVYAGQPRYSLRVRNNDFDLEHLAIGIQEAHALGKKFFLASNIMPHNAKVASYLKDITPVIEMGPDALIMSDPGLIHLVREQWPDMPIHLSVQANTMNWATVKFWHSMGIERVILSRELSLDEVAEIRQRCPEMEIEVFVHGALCIAYSGRCLLSGYFNRRDPNQGTCTNSCRWDYKVHEAEEDPSGDIRRVEPATFQPAPEQQVYLLEEPNRPGELMPIMEDETGTYIMNSRDLRAIEHVQRLVDIGVNSLKIEGRTKSHYYVARTAQIYRRAIDDAVAGRPFDASLLGALDGLANRGYTDGFYQRHHDADYQNYLDGNSKSFSQQFVGEIAGYDSETGMIDVIAKNKFSVGDSLEIILPQGNRTITLDYMEDMKGKAVEVAPGSGHRVRFKLELEHWDKGLIARNLADQPEVGQGCS